jgi:hypothetical protein
MSSLQVFQHFTFQGLLLMNRLPVGRTKAYEKLSISSQIFSEKSSILDHQQNVPFLLKSFFNFSHIQ